MITGVLGNTIVLSLFQVGSQLPILKKLILSLRKMYFYVVNFWNHAILKTKLQTGSHGESIKDLGTASQYTDL